MMDEILSHNDYETIIEHAFEYENMKHMEDYIMKHYKKHFPSNNLFYSEIADTLMGLYKFDENIINLSNSDILSYYKYLNSNNEKAVYLYAYSLRQQELEWIKQRDALKYTYNSAALLYKKIDSWERTSDIIRKLTKKQRDLSLTYLLELSDAFKYIELEKLEKLNSDSLAVLCRLFFTVNFNFKESSKLLIIDNRYSPHKNLYAIEPFDSSETKEVSDFRDGVYANIFLEMFNDINGEENTEKKSRLKIPFNSFNKMESKKWKLIITKLSIQTDEMFLVKKYINFLIKNEEQMVECRNKFYRPKIKELNADEIRLKKLLKVLEKDHCLESATTFFNYIVHSNNERKIIFKESTYFVALFIDYIKKYFSQFKRNLEPVFIDKNNLLFIQTKNEQIRQLFSNTLKKALNRSKSTHAEKQKAEYKTVEDKAQIDQYLKSIFENC